MRYEKDGLILDINVGDEYHHPKYAKGVVTYISTYENTMTPIQMHFDEAALKMSFTPSGRRYVTQFEPDIQFNWIVPPPDKWDTRFIELAKLFGSWSKDPSTKAGAVIVRGKKPIAHGYNGFPAGVPDTAEHLNSRDEKYPRIIHAELNAILTATESLQGTTIYCTHFPCSRCTANIIQVGIIRVVCPKPPEDFITRWGADMIISKDMFSKKGIKVDEL